MPSSLNWLELDRRARAIAVRLTRLAGPGERVAILCPQNLDYVVGFLGALYAGTIAVPLFAPEEHSHSERLFAALTDCTPKVWLTSSSALPAVHELRNNSPVPRPRRLVVVDRVGDRDADGFTPVPLAPQQVAYLQYTSGSTRRPAGVVITHRAVMANIAQAKVAFDVDETTTSAGWLPFFHDMGLLQLICMPVAVGCRSVFTTPAAFTRRPVRWLRMLAQYPNTLTAAPNFAFEYAAAKLTEDDLAELDLSGVSVAINGSEPVRSGTVDSFFAATKGIGFAETAHRPSYGLAEATVFVSTTLAGTKPKAVGFDRDRLAAGVAVPLTKSDDRAITLMSTGGPVGQRLRIVDPESRRALPDGVLGEIWVQGANVASGYWGQARDTEGTFGAELLGADAVTPATGWLRTGDLGVIHDDDLFVTGRLKDLIVIDGRNHHPQDIEETVQDAHPAIRRDRLAVFSVERDGREAPVVVAERSQRTSLAELDSEEVGRVVRAAVSVRHDLWLADFVLVRPGAVPRTSSGKIARSATRARYLDGGLSTECP